MVKVSHVVFIDESGICAPGGKISSLWISAAVAVPLERARDLQSQLEQVKRANFLPRMGELKGTVMRQNLLRGRSLEVAAAEVSGLLSTFNAHVWVVATRRGCRTLAGTRASLTSPKGIARQLLLERINGFLNLGHYDPASWLIVWDVSDVQELRDFSHSVSIFENAFTGDSINPRLFPLVLGGLSHDWAALQLVDVVSHLALHRRGADLGLGETNAAKADLFTRYVYPHLQRDAGGRCVGWKTWD